MEALFSGTFNGAADDSSHHSDQCSLPAYLRAPEVPVQVMAEYIWLASGTGQLRSKTKVLDRKPACPEEAPVMVVEAAISREAAEDNHELFLKPRKIFRDPFRGGDHILVLCDAFLCAPQVQSDPVVPPATVLHPAESNTRVAAENVLKMAHPSQPVFAVEQEYAVIHPAYPTMVPLGPRRPSASTCSRRSRAGSNSRNGKVVKKTAFPSAPSMHQPASSSFGSGSLSHENGANAGAAHAKAARQLADAHLRCCLFAGVKVSGADVHSLAGLHSFKIGPSPGVDLCDDLTTSRYLLSRVAEDKGMFVSWDPNAMPDERPLTCSFKFSTAETRASPVGLPAIEQQLARLQAAHIQHQVAYNNGRLERLASPESRTFTHVVGAANASIVVPSLTYLQQGGYYTDRRPPADADPYKVVLMLVATALDLPLPQLPAASSSGMAVSAAAGLSCQPAPTARAGAGVLAGSPLNQYLLAVQAQNCCAYDSESDDCNYDSCSETDSMDTDDVLLDELARMDDECEGGGGGAPQAGGPGPRRSGSTCGGGHSDGADSVGTSPSRAWTHARARAAMQQQVEGM